MREFPLHTVQIVYVRFTMREFPLHKWLYTMAQSLRTIYYAGVPLTSIGYTVQCDNVYVRFTMREFPFT